MILPIIVLLPLLSVVRAANDWNTPCFNGECSWDLPATIADGTPGGAGTMVVVSIKVYHVRFEHADSVRCDRKALQMPSLTYQLRRDG
jgi:hypothetical protein